MVTFPLPDEYGVEILRSEVGSTLHGTGLPGHEDRDEMGIYDTPTGPRSRFCPPSLVARDEPYCLFLDEPRSVVDDHFPALERRRTYLRLSRRQSASPDIPRPGLHLPAELVERRTFGVVLDTSGSMERTLLAKALGAIASYATTRDVPAARVVFCDAAAYDAGYLEPHEIAGRVRVRGRGGTILQPGVDLLETAADFPDDGPILLITDGQCDAVRVRREHAWLIPDGARLPVVPRGPVFRLQ